MDWKLSILLRQQLRNKSRFMDWKDQNRLGNKFLRRNRLREKMVVKIPIRTFKKGVHFLKQKPRPRNSISFHEARAALSLSHTPLIKIIDLNNPSIPAVKWDKVKGKGGKNISVRAQAQAKALHVINSTRFDENRPSVHFNYKDGKPIPAIPSKRRESSFGCVGCAKWTTTMTTGPHEENVSKLFIKIKTLTKFYASFSKLTEKLNFSNYSI